MKKFAKLTFGLMMIAGVAAQAKGPKLFPTQDEREPVTERVVASETPMESKLEKVSVESSESAVHPMMERMWMKEFRNLNYKI